MSNWLYSENDKKTREVYEDDNYANFEKYDIDPNKSIGFEEVRRKYSEEITWFYPVAIMKCGERREEKNDE